MVLRDGRPPVPRVSHHATTYASAALASPKPAATGTGRPAAELASALTSATARTR